MRAITSAKSHAGAFSPPGPRLGPTRRRAAYEALQREHQHASPFAVMFQEVEIAAVRPGVRGFHLGAASERTSYAEVAKG